MPNEITEDDLLEMEAYDQSIIDKARRLRAKLQSTLQQQKKSRFYISPERRVRVEAERTKVELRRIERQKQKTGL